MPLPGPPASREQLGQRGRHGVCHDLRAAGQELKEQEAKRLAYEEVDDVLWYSASMS